MSRYNNKFVYHYAYVIRKYNKDNTGINIRNIKSKIIGYTNESTSRGSAPISHCRNSPNIQ